MREIKAIFEKSTGYVFVVSYPKDAHDEFAIELMGHPTQLFSSKKELDEKLKSGVWAACKEPAHPVRHIHADHMIAAANDVSIEWQFKYYGEWICIDKPDWNVDVEYRQKPKDREFPKCQHVAEIFKGIKFGETTAKEFAEYIANEAIKFHILDCEKINESTVNPVHDFNSDK